MRDVRENPPPTFALTRKARVEYLDRRREELEIIKSLVVRGDKDGLRHWIGHVSDSAPLFGFPDLEKAIAPLKMVLEDMEAGGAATASELLAIYSATLDEQTPD